MKTNTLDFDARALRERILDLAMRGKLVPQDPNDEPASVLLEKIKTEKAELIKEKKIKKTKALPAITDDDKPFDIPDSWEWVRLGDVTDVVMGQAPKGSNVNDQGEGIEFHQGKTEFTETVIGKSSKYTTDSNKIVDSNFIIMAVRAPVGDVNLLDRKISIGRGLAGIAPYISNKIYIFYYLESIKNYFERRSTGSTFKAINGNTIKNAVVPLPPLSEQSRIAAKIAQLFALLRKVESSTQQYAELQTLLKSKVLDLAMHGELVKQDPDDEPASVLLEKIKAEKAELVREKKIKKSKPLPPINDEEKPFDIPDSWEWVRLGDVLDVRDGTHDTPKYVADGIPLITSKNISNGKLDFTNINFISKDDFEKINERSKVDKGDIIFAMIGTIGNPVLVDTDTKFGIKNVALLKHFTDKLNMDFILDYLLVLQVIWNSNATGAVQKFVSLRKIRKSVLPLPPFKEQKKIVRKIDQIFRMIGE
jgi:type I restriction enzyme S subunit